MLVKLRYLLYFQGVVPATIAVKNGVFRVGLEADEMENLSRAGEEGRAIKCSTRDLPLVAASRQDCASILDQNVQWGGMWRLLLKEIFSFCSRLDWYAESCC